MAIPPQILPSQWNFDNFVTALESLPFVNLYINTALLIVLRVLCAVVFSSMAGYAFAKLQFPCKNLLFSIILIQMMLPSQIFITPQYLMLAKVGLNQLHLRAGLPRHRVGLRHLLPAAVVPGHPQ